MTRRFTAHESRPTPTDRSAAPSADPVPSRARAAAAKFAKTVRPPKAASPAKPKETGGPSGPEPTRYGDWERKGICVDF